jgi:hypothetical protein
MRFQTYGILKKVKRKNERLNFPAGMKAQQDEGGERILLGDNTSGRAVMLRPIRFQRVGFCI